MRIQVKKFQCAIYGCLYWDWEWDLGSIFSSTDWSTSGANAIKWCTSTLYTTAVLSSSDWNEWSGSHLTHFLTICTVDQPPTASLIYGWVGVFVFTYMMRYKWSWILMNSWSSVQSYWWKVIHTRVRICHGIITVVYYQQPWQLASKLNTTFSVCKCDVYGNQISSSESVYLSLMLYLKKKIL
jgi:hypothetical protein